ncbi:hypothetical protein KKG52_03385 [Patescibacteria group bacterium]|nr:hypothetical protein [Patescibacteria group bacterium]
MNSEEKFNLLRQYKLFFNEVRQSKILSILSMLPLLIAIPLTITISKQQQQTQQEASFDININNQIGICVKDSTNPKYKCTLPNTHCDVPPGQNYGTCKDKTPKRNVTSTTKVNSFPNITCGSNLYADKNCFESCINNSICTKSDDNSPMYKCCFYKPANQ